MKDVALFERFFSLAISTVAAIAFVSVVAENRAKGPHRPYPAFDEKERQMFIVQDYLRDVLLPVEAADVTACRTREAGDPLTFPNWILDAPKNSPAEAWLKTVAAKDPVDADVAYQLVKLATSKPYQCNIAGRYHLISHVEAKPEPQLKWSLSPTR